MIDDEHKRLATAAEHLLEAIDPDWWGDMPAALEYLARVVRARPELAAAIGDLPR